MKVIIDLIEDMQTAIKDKEDFSLSVMALEEGENSQFNPVWQNDVVSFKVDTQENKLFIFLGKTQALNTEGFLKEMNALENKEMMYEVNVSYLKDDKRVDIPLIGFGESMEDKKYLLFMKA